MHTNKWLLRFKVTIIGILVVVPVSVGLVLTLIGVQSLAARILYSILSVTYSLYALYEVYNDALALFNKTKQDDKLVTFYTLLDATVGYLLSGSLLLMLFWVWGEDTFFTLVGTWSTVSPFRTWIRFFVTSILVGTGVGFTLYIPRHEGSEIFIALFSLFSFLINVFVVAIGISVALDNGNEKNRSNLRDDRGTHPLSLSQNDVILSSAPCIGATGYVDLKLQ